MTEPYVSRRQRMNDTAPPVAFLRIPDVPADLLAAALATNDAAAVYVAVKDYLREATNEPSRLADAAAWQVWCDLYLDEIADIAESYATGRR